MRLFLQIDLGDWKQRDYNHVLVPYASSLANDLIGADIDNESESTVIDLVIKLAEQAESLFVFISAKSNAALGSTDKLLRYLHQHQAKIHHVVVVGEHADLKKFAQNFDRQLLKANDTGDVKKLLLDFAEKIPTPDRTSGLAP